MSDLMVLFQKIITKMERKEIMLEIENALNHRFSDNGELAGRINFTLYDLAMAIGHTNNFGQPTERPKFYDSLKFIKRIIRDRNSDLRVNFTEYPEYNTEISCKLGEGISAIVAAHLFGVDVNTIKRIKPIGRGKRADFIANSQDYGILKWEAKGSRYNFPLSVIRDVRDKKGSGPKADLSFGTLAKFEETSISKVTVIDPPSDKPFDRERQISIMRAAHYSQLFNYIGQKKLSLYFSYLGKRLSERKDFREYGKKIEILNEIKRDYVECEINGESYLGNVDKIDGGHFVFIGINKKLFRIEDFVNFKPEFKEGYIEKVQGNRYAITKDGLCFGEIKNLQPFGIEERDVPHYQESTSIIDFDSMDYFSILNFFIYIFGELKLRYEIETSHSAKNHRCDILLFHGGAKFAIEIKRRIDLVTYDTLKNFEKQGYGKPVLITPQRLTLDEKKHALKHGILLFDRTEIKKLLKRHEHMLHFLGMLK